MYHTPKTKVLDPKIKKIKKTFNAEFDKSRGEEQLGNLWGFHKKTNY
jgi:hypothetical protein